MDELISLVVFIIFIGGSIVKSISEAKKRRQAELEEPLTPSEEDFETIDFEMEEVPPPRPAPKPVTKAEGWEDLKQQLERMLGEPEAVDTPRETQPAATPTPIPPVRSPATFAPAPANKKDWSSRYREMKRAAQEAVATQRESWKIPTPTRDRPQPETGHGPTPKPATASRVQPIPRPTLAARRRAARKAAKNPFEFHPNPFANAIILNEILQPRRRNCLAVRRPTSASR